MVGLALGAAASSWVEYRILRPDGRVVTRLLTDRGAQAAAAVAEEADRLTARLGGAVVVPSRLSFAGSSTS